jgi:hypothetical protein
MKNHVLSLGLSLVLLSSSASAGWSSTENVRINRIEIVSSSAVSTTFLAFSSMPNNRPSCHTATEAVVEGSVEHKVLVTEVATAAYLAGKKVRVYWNGQCASGGRGQVTRILVQ